MVFLPLTRQALTQLRQEGVLKQRLTGHAATAALLRSHDYDQSSLEDADYSALTYAGVQAVMVPEAEPQRLVVAAELPDRMVDAHPDDPYGEAEASELRWEHVRALFVDEPAAGAAVTAAEVAATGHDLAAALSLPAVVTLLEEHELLWYAPEELDRLP